MRRLLTAAILTVVTIVGFRVSPAFSDYTGPQATGAVGPGGPSASAGTGGAVQASAPTVGSPSGGGGSGPCPAGQTVGYVPATSGGQLLVSQPGDLNPITGQPVQPGSSMTSLYCNGVYMATVVVPPGGAGVTGVSPLLLAQRALANAPFPPLSVAMTPPAGREAVNFPIWLSLGSGFAPVSTSASAGAVTSTVWIVPTSVTFSMGDGASVSCRGRGVPFNFSDSFDAQLVAATGLPPCGYKYQRSSADQAGQAFQVTATVHYSATWAAVGAPGGGNLPAVDRSVTLPVKVGEIQVVNS